VHPDLSLSLLEHVPIWLSYRLKIAGLAGERRGKALIFNAGWLFYKAGMLRFSGSIALHRHPKSVID
jgi:hypothetical protein